MTPPDLRSRTRGPRPARPTGSSARLDLRPWPGDPRTAHLVVVDHHRAPDPEELERALERARARGCVRARTSALFPTVTPVFLAAGFTPIDTLALLRRDVDAASDPGGRLPGSWTDVPDAPTTGGTTSLARRRADRSPAVTRTADGRATGNVEQPTIRLRPLRRHHHRIAAEIDRLAFGDPWANDRTSLAEIRHATPVHRAMRSTSGRRTTGFAITGLAADTAYLQRLAVHPAHHRQGVGTALVADALDWAVRCGTGTVMVNTGVENHAALRLYRRFGFHELAQRLTVAELLLPDAPAHGRRRRRGRTDASGGTSP